MTGARKFVTWRRNGVLSQERPLFGFTCLLNLNGRGRGSSIWTLECYGLLWNVKIKSYPFEDHSICRTRAVQFPNAMQDSYGRTYPKVKNIFDGQVILMDEHMKQTLLRDYIILIILIIIIMIQTMRANMCLKVAPKQGTHTHAEGTSFGAPSLQSKPQKVGWEVGAVRIAWPFSR